MTNDNILNNIFFSNFDMSEQEVAKVTAEAISGVDDGELFMEFCQSENLTFDDGVLKNANFDTSCGFGLRAVLGETTGYAHSSELSLDAIKRASKTVQAVKSGYEGDVSLYKSPKITTQKLYSDANPLSQIPFEEKVKLLAEIDAYLRAKDSRVKQVSVSIAGEWQAVQIIRADGHKVGDIRPLVRLNVSVVAESNGRMERGGHGMGGRSGYAEYITADKWKYAADEALRQAFVNLESVDAKAGEMDIVLGPGWPGVLLHEAVGHGLEGDYNRKKTSNFSELMGTQVAAKGVTVVDNGTIEGRRGSLNIDDEGTPTKENVLIEDGILVSYMQDRTNARLMNVEPTGNGRRESYEHQPFPRMTNTYMLNGDKSPEEIISSVKNGLYAVSFGGGQVDTTSGKFVFSASEAYKIENGKITAPVKGATLIGNGPDVMRKIDMIGNDMSLDEGIGTCGKEGQSVPVGVGQPTIRVKNVTVGGTEV